MADDNTTTTTAPTTLVTDTPKTDDTTTTTTTAPADPNRDVVRPEDDLYPDDTQADDTQADDTKADDTKADDTKADDTKADDTNADDTQAEVDPDVVPEDGEYALTMRDGFTLNQELLSSVSPLLKDMGATHGQAQKLADALADYELTKSEGAQDAFARVVEDWSERTKADPELGGENFEANLATAKRALDVYGTKDLRTALDNSGLGSHPEIIRMLVKVGNGITDDDVPQVESTTAKTSANALEAAAEDLYGGTTPTTNKR